MNEFKNVSKHNTSMSALCALSLPAVCLLNNLTPVLRLGLFLDSIFSLGRKCLI
ncbi:hypothetical protein FC93_GL001370 [Lactobacillus kefiranofaciens subsp. kefiranofaciens DSM 5016 = JCM 6985]|nr:hypothetical protein FC93_GL001370 [Lactobacillus kefiranofaciens subsp. kefiranofaciens DSM 5016 = JCM 6985]